MKIEIWSDFACPFCYIGKTKFEQALNQFEHKNEVEITYKAYQLNPNAPKVMKENAYETFAKGHHMSIEDAKQRFKMFSQRAKEVGLTYNYDIIQMTNTFDAHRLAKYANTKNLETQLTTRLMKAYFTEGKNLSDFNTLTQLAEEVGLEKEETMKVLKNNQYKDIVLEQIQQAHMVGVTGVPFFVINRKYGVSGAQDTNYFLSALNQIYQEQQSIEKLDDHQNGQSCQNNECNF